MYDQILANMSLVERRVLTGTVQSTGNFAVPPDARRIGFRYRIKQAEAFQCYLRYNGIRTASETIQFTAYGFNPGLARTIAGRDSSGLQIVTGTQATSLQCSGEISLTVETGWYRDFHCEGRTFDSLIENGIGRGTQGLVINDGHIDDTTTVITTVDIWCSGGAKMLAGSDFEFFVGY